MIPQWRQGEEKGVWEASLGRRQTAEGIVHLVPAWGERSMRWGQNLMSRRVQVPAGMLLAV